MKPEKKVCTTFFIFLVSFIFIHLLMLIPYLLFNQLLKKTSLRGRSLPKFPLWVMVSFTPYYKVYLYVPLLMLLLTCPDEIVSIANVIRRSSKIASTCVIRREMLDLINTLTPSSLDLVST